MVAYVFKCDLDPSKADTYQQWQKSAVPRLKAGPGLIGMSVYRPAAGSSQLVIINEFSDVAAWHTWWNDHQVQNVFNEARAYLLNISTELWTQISREGVAN